MEKDNSEPKKEQEGKGGKSKEAKMVLQEMDQQNDPDYKKALMKVLKETGVDRAKLEKELEKYI